MAKAVKKHQLSAKFTVATQAGPRVENRGYDLRAIAHFAAYPASDLPAG